MKSSNVIYLLRSARTDTADRSSHLILFAEKMGRRQIILIAGCFLRRAASSVTSAHFDSLSDAGAGWRRQATAWLVLIVSCEELLFLSVSMGSIDLFVFYLCKKEYET